MLTDGKTYTLVLYTLKRHALTLIGWASSRERLYTSFSISILTFTLQKVIQIIPPPTLIFAHHFFLEINVNIFLLHLLDEDANADV